VTTDKIGHNTLRIFSNTDSLCSLSIALSAVHTSEPGTLLLVVSGLVSLGFVRCRPQRAKTGRLGWACEAQQFFGGWRWLDTSKTIRQSTFLALLGAGW